jgi:hypothetical protein
MPHLSNKTRIFSGSGGPVRMDEISFLVFFMLPHAAKTELLVFRQFPVKMKDLYVSYAHGPLSRNGK